MSQKVQAMFARIAKNYDLLNRVLSFGIDKIWRKKAARLALPFESVLDLACGTGDFAIELAKIAPTAKIIATDFCPEMLEIAKDKFIGQGANIVAHFADATDLPFDDNSFDACTIAFGIRNVDSCEVALKEMARVVKPNGKVIILEFGQPKGFFAVLYKFYSKYYIPFVGKLISKDDSAYKYLPETAAVFPADNLFLNLMNSVDAYSKMEAKKLFLGVAYIYIGIVK